MSQQPSVLAIIVSHNTRDLTLSAVRSCLDQVRPFGGRIVVVDNASTDDTVLKLQELNSGIQTILNDSNRGFAAANNQVLAGMDEDFALLLNSDAELMPSCLEQLIGFMILHPRCGICGPTLLRRTGRRQRSQFHFPTITGEMLKFLGISASAREALLNFKLSGSSMVDSLLGACLLVRRKAIDEVGMLDEGFWFFLEETDWCYRMHKKGWEVHYVRDAECLHVGGASAKALGLAARAHFWRGLIKFFAKHYGQDRAITLKKLLLVRMRAKMLISSGERKEELRLLTREIQGLNIEKLSN